MDRPDPGDLEVWEGFEYVAVPEPALEWRVMTGWRCRYGAAPGKKACGRPAVAEMNRASYGQPRWWAYCENHLYGRWIEDGHMMCWILRALPLGPEGNEDAGT